MSVLDVSGSRDPSDEPQSELRDFLADIGGDYPFTFVDAPVAGEDWARFKRAWKEAEAAVDLPTLTLLAPTIDTMTLSGRRQRPSETILHYKKRWARRPSKETVQYMKRRARRFMRGLAETDLDSYATIAVAVLSHPVNGNEPFHADMRWVAADILFGGGTRVRPDPHGRGGYQNASSLAPRRRREERAPEAWDRRLEVLATLLVAESIAPEIRLMALKALRANGQELPHIGLDIARVFMESSVPVLASVGRSVVLEAFVAGETVPADLAALAWFLAPAGVQQRVASGLKPRTTDEAWLTVFATALADQMLKSLTHQPTPVAHSWTLKPERARTRRVRAAATLLAGPLVGLFAEDAMIECADVLLESDVDELTDLVLSLVTNADVPTALRWLNSASHHVPRMFPALQTALSGKPVDLQTAIKLVGDRGPLPYPAERWELLERMQINLEVLERLWRRLASEALRPATSFADSMGRGPRIQHLREAVEQPAAIRLLARVLAASPQFLLDMREVGPIAARISPEAIAYAQFRLEFPTDVDRIMSASERFVDEPLVRSFARDGEPAEIALLVVVVDPPRWQLIEGWLLEELTKSARWPEFWSVAWPIAASDSTAPLVERVLSTHTGLEGFLATDITGIEVATAPELEPFMVRWLERHVEEFRRGSDRLFAVVTHLLPRVQVWGAARVQQVGANDAFLLRLLESRHLEAMRLAREMALNPAREEPLDLAVMFYDSPDSQVRELGRHIATARAAEIPLEALLTRLSEHPDPIIQAEIARRAEQEGVALPPEFAHAVMRRRNQARRAKEFVKRSLTEPIATDVTLLLELARGSSAVDAEWAMARLADLAMTGKEIEGVAVDGVAGV